MKVMFLVGEVSGEQRATELFARMAKLYPGAEFYGMGGAVLRAAGYRVEYDNSALSVVGLLEILTILRQVKSALKYVKNTLQENIPDLLVCVDYQGFNIRAAKLAAKYNVPVFFYVGPQVWASRPWRIKNYARYVKHMAVLFPFEKTLYKDHDIDVQYFGHPLVKTMAKVMDQTTARQQLALPEGRRVLAILPGSRVNEVKSLLPVLCEVADMLGRQYQGMKILLAQSSNISNDLLQSLLSPSSLDNVQIVPNEDKAALAAADFLIAASGTVTLEAALLNKPMVVVYKLSALTFFIYKKFLCKLEHVSLPNIVAGHAVVQELLQKDCNAERIMQEITKIIDDVEYRQRMQQELSAIAKALAGGSAPITMDVWLQTMMQGLAQSEPAKLT
jgi:lipid-A-disaccharide synthase